jgi:hypothetical protein
MSSNSGINLQNGAAASQLESPEFAQWAQQAECIGKYGRWGVGMAREQVAVSREANDLQRGLLRSATEAPATSRGAPTASGTAQRPR